MINTNTEKLLGELENPFTTTYVMDIDSSSGRSKAMAGCSPCMTRSRYKGHWLSTRGRRMNIDEMLRLQGFQPSQFRTVVLSSELGKQCGNAMSVNVLERVLAKLLPAARLAVTHKRARRLTHQTQAMSKDSTASLDADQQHLKLCAFDC